LLVSHDQLFLDRLTHRRWHISRDDANPAAFRLGDALATSERKKGV
jgi:ATPase subunit of ABC transporter with duplicated ATPase domains